jgi:hypothetical protein
MGKHYPTITNINNARKKQKTAGEASGSGDLPEGARGVSMEVDGDAGSSGAVTDNVTGTSAAGGSSGASGSTAQGGGVRGSAILPVGLPILGATYTRTFNKQYKIRIFNRPARRRNFITDGVVYNVWVPSYDDIPVSHLGFYLYDAEFKRLQMKTKAVVKEVAVNVFSETAVFTFETLGSVTATSNNNAGIKMVNIRPEIGLARMGRYVNPQSVIVKEIFQGVNPSTLEETEIETEDMSGLGAEYIRRNYKNPFSYYTIKNVLDSGIPPTDGSGAEINQGFFPVDRYIQKRINSSINEGPLTSMTFKPKSGLIVSHNALAEYNCPGGQRTINKVGFVHMHRALDTGPAEKTTNQRYMKGQSITDPDYEQKALMPQNFRNYQDLSDVCVDPYSTGGMGHERFPVMSFGFETFTSINTSDAAPKYQPAHCDLTIEASIEIEITEGGFMTDNSRSYRQIENDFMIPPPQQLQIWTDGLALTIEDSQQLVSHTKKVRNAETVLSMAPLAIQEFVAAAAAKTVIPDPLDTGPQIAARKKQALRVNALKEQMKTAKTVDVLSKLTLELIEHQGGHHVPPTPRASRLQKRVRRQVPMTAEMVESNDSEEAL